VTKEYKYLYWPEPPSIELKEAIVNLDISAAVEMLNYGVCVKECPKSDPATPIDCKTTTYIAENQPAKFTGCTYKITADYFTQWGFTDEATSKYIETFSDYAE